MKCSLVKNEKRNEYFVYMVMKYETNVEDSYITLVGLTDAGKELEYIVIPDEIEGYPMKVINGWANARNLKKIYISKNIERVVGGRWLTSETEYKTLYVRFNCTDSSTGWFLNPHISSLAEDNYKKIHFHYSIANLNYTLNYKNSTNGGIHFVDNLDVGEKVVIVPLEPNREGYTFKGWYLDKDCTEVFDMASYVRKEEDGIMYIYAGW